MRKGFSIFELILSIGLIVVLGGIAILAMNPSGQVAKARNSQRNADLNTIMNGIRLNLADNRNSFSCGAGDIPTTATLRMASAGTSSYDIAPCIIPTYIPLMPFDPLADDAHYGGSTDYDSGYYITRNASTGLVTLSAPFAELSSTISITR